MTLCAGETDTGPSVTVGGAASTPGSQLRWYTSPWRIASLPCAKSAREQSLPSAAVKRGMLERSAALTEVVAARRVRPPSHCCVRKPLRKMASRDLENAERSNCWGGVVDFGKRRSARKGVMG